MTKKKDIVETSTATKNPEVETEQETRTPRKKVYERVSQSSIPEYVQEEFRKDNYELKLVRWAVEGEEDYRYLARRETEGYEFVTVDELPIQYRSALKLRDAHGKSGLVTTGDLCLMKIDIDLRNSRRDYFQNIADRQVQAVDVNVLEKKGFITKGTKSTVSVREPSFQ
jgi:hypothetical protein